MKPYGLRIGLTDGLPSLQVTKGNRATDAIWDGVEAAIAIGMAITQITHHDSSHFGNSA